MTGDEGDLIQKVVNDYYFDFSRLVADTLKKAPPHFRDHLLMRLQETSSVYGSRYEKYL